ncbi:MAG: hypothetical protein AB7E32_16535 [Desulfovibrio sp.]
MEQHRWNREDEILALYLSLYPKSPESPESAELNRSKVAEARGMSAGSLDMKIRNFASLRGIGQLSHCSSLTKRVFDEFSQKTEAEHREICLEVLAGTANPA